MTNIGSKFLSLIDKHFKNSPLGKYFNRKTIKVSYSCLPNISAIISGHNQKLIQGQVAKQKQEDVRECNCKAGKADCPLQGHCLQKGIIYKASLKSAVGNNTYIGQAGNTFKERFTSHKASFKNRKYETSTALSKQIWRIKDSNLAYDLKWEKLASASTYQPKIGKCNLCNLEKTIILFSTDKNVLNKRSELMNKCRHRNKYLLSAIKWGTVIWKRNFFKNRDWKSSSQPWKKSTNFKKIHNIIPPPASDECTSTKQVVMLPPINFDIKWSFLPELISSIILYVYVSRTLVTGWCLYSTPKKKVVSYIHSWDLFTNQQHCSKWTRST